MSGKISTEGEKHRKLSNQPHPPKKITTYLGSAVFAFLFASLLHCIFTSAFPTASTRRSHSQPARSHTPPLPKQNTLPNAPHPPPSAAARSESAHRESSALRSTSTHSHRCSTGSPHSP